MIHSENDSTGRIPAVAYARMSTDGQNHSIKHQLDCIYTYATTHGLEILRVYADEGRSGLSLLNRPQLQELLAAATDAACDFSVIMVYDVSRWGRFQDVDEGAFHEYLCRRAGVAVVYCAEQFVDDGSPLYAIMKGIKRAMAAEYSRELSAKVFRAQCRFSLMGYKQGGRAGYGLRRIPVVADGESRRPLEAGERKPMLTDRITLTPGLPEEVALVRSIYHWYIEDGWSDSRIARHLRADGGTTHMGSPWDPSTVRRILTNERYCGELLFNQTTRRLHSKVEANPEELWIRCHDAFEPIVSRPYFEKARNIRTLRAAGPAPEDVLGALRAIYQRHGTINIELCKASSLPGRETMLRLFGGYVQAYAAAGLPSLHTPSGALGIRTMRALIEGLLKDVGERALRAGGTICKTQAWNVLLLNDTLKLKVSIASCRRYPDSWRRWRVALRKGGYADFVLCALMDTDNVNIRCYALMATAEAAKDSLFLSERTLGRYSASCFTTLDEIFGLS